MWDSKGGPCEPGPQGEERATRAVPLGEELAPQGVLARPASAAGDCGSRGSGSRKWMWELQAAQAEGARRREGETERVTGRKRLREAGADRWGWGGRERDRERRGEDWI